MSRDAIPGWETMTWIYDEWIASRPRPGAVVVEVGVALGKSISYLCGRLREHGRRDVQVYAVDPWAGTERNGEQQGLADAAGGDFTLFARQMLEHDPESWEMIRVLRVPSVNAARVFDVGEVDLVTLDGDHRELSVRTDLVAWNRVLRMGGWIGGDDATEPGDPHHHGSGVLAALHNYYGPHGFEIRRTNAHNHPTWLRKGFTIL